MAEDIRIGCSCGTVSGVLRSVGPTEGDRYICHCDNCQAFAQFTGRADEVLDAYAGVSVYQTRVAKLELESGADQLACINLTKKPTTRWYSTCCRTPMFTTLATGKYPFLSVVTFAVDENRRDAVLGPADGHVFTEFAKGNVGDVPKTATFLMMFRVIKRMLADRLSGDWKRSPLFDAAGAPIAIPTRIMEDPK